MDWGTIEKAKEVVRICLGELPLRSTLCDITKHIFLFKCESINQSWIFLGTEILSENIDKLNSEQYGFFAASSHWISDPGTAAGALVPAPPLLSGCKTPGANGMSGGERN